MNKKVIIGAVILVVIIGGYFVLHKTPASTPTAASSTASGTSQTSAATITYANNGFGPSPIMVKSGDTVTVNNTSSVELQLESDPHPIHTDDIDLNVGLVSAGQTKTFTVTQKGTFGFHNHLKPSDRGSITIQ